MFYIIMKAKHYHTHLNSINNKSNCLMFKDIFLIRFLKNTLYCIERLNQTINDHQKSTNKLVTNKVVS